MNKPDTASLRRAPPGRGVVRAEVPQGALFGERLLPPPELEPFVHHFWWLVWDLRAPFSAEGPNPPALAVLADALGYADQAHFARDFKQVVGCAPGAFTRTSRPSQSKPGT